MKKREALSLIVLAMLAVAALLVSPFGIPMLALKLVFLVGTAGDAIREVVY